MGKTRLKRPLGQLYELLLRSLGRSGWWPAQTKFEVIVGALLTQNTAWSNVERAIDNLKREGLLSVKKLDALNAKRLAALIRPAGYFNVKARRLKELVNFLMRNYNGSLKVMSKRPLKKLREALLEVKGVGPETADSILLYALDKPVFVVDAYTKRVLIRHGLVDGSADYETIQRLFMENIPNSARLFNEYHALIVRLAKEFCRAKPKCEICPVLGIFGKPSSLS